MPPNAQTPPHEPSSSPLMDALEPTIGKPSSKLNRALIEVETVEPSAHQASPSDNKPAAEGEVSVPHSAQSVRPFAGETASQRVPWSGSEDPESRRSAQVRVGVRSPSNCSASGSIAANSDPNVWLDSMASLDDSHSSSLRSDASPASEGPISVSNFASGDSKPISGEEIFEEPSRTERAELQLKIEQRFSPGTIVAGKFKIHRLFARGGMGSVFLGEQLPLNRMVALKTVVPLTGDPEFRRRFLVEASSAGRLNHRNIVTIHDYGETEAGDLYMAMEYLQGTTLRVLLSREGQLEPRRACAIAQQIGRALRTAHRSGVVHRDLKPANIMLVADEESDHGEQVKVLDFGLAKLTEVSAGPTADLTQSGLIVGSPRFMAPEQIISGPTDPRTDIYSLGAMLFQMLTGRTPYDAKESYEILRAHLNAEVPDVKSIPQLRRSKALADLIERSLCKDPNHRPQSMDEVLEALDVAMHELGAKPRVPSHSLSGHIALPQTADMSASFLRYTAMFGGQPALDNRRALWKMGILWMSVGILLAGVLAGIMEWKTVQKEAAKAPIIAPVQPKVRLDLSSEPPGASVTVNSIFLGITPLEVSMPLEPGPSDNHEIQFQKDGFIPFTMTSAFDKGAIQVHAVLERRPAAKAKAEVPRRPSKAAPRPKRATGVRARPAKRAAEKPDSPGPSPKPAPPNQPNPKVPALVPERTSRVVPVMD